MSQNSEKENIPPPSAKKPTSRGPGLRPSHVLRELPELSFSLAHSKTANFCSDRIVRISPRETRGTSSLSSSSDLSPESEESKEIDSDPEEEKSLPLPVPASLPREGEPDPRRPTCPVHKLRKTNNDSHIRSDFLGLWNEEKRRTEMFRLYHERDFTFEGKFQDVKLREAVPDAKSRLEFRRRLPDGGEPDPGGAPVPAEGPCRGRGGQQVWQGCGSQHRTVRSFGGKRQLRR